MANKKSATAIAASAGIDITGGQQVVSSDLLRTISGLAEELRGIDSKMESMDAEYKNLNDRKNEIQLTLLPDRMIQAGMAEFTLTTGDKVAVDDFLNASIPTESAISKEKDASKKDSMLLRRKNAFAWLRKVKAASLIKTEVVAMFGKGQDKAAIELTTQIKKLGITVICEQAVHPQTLQAFLRECMKNGTEVPSEPFALFTGKRATIKKGKKQ